MTDQITPQPFHNAEGIADWRVVGDPSMPFAALAETELGETRSSPNGAPLPSQLPETGRR
jgi:hypothetical protein